MVRASENGKVKHGGVGGGGQTIKIGATGKVSALMMQELDTNIKNSSKKVVIESRRIQTAPVSIHCGVSTKKLQRMVSLDGGRSNTPQKNNSNRNARKALQKIPMLDSEDVWIDKTPMRGGLHDKKVVKRIVETVDLKCGKHVGDWSMIPIDNQLRRLSFSKILD